MKKIILISSLLIASIGFHFNSLSAQICEGIYQVVDGKCQDANGIYSDNGQQIVINFISDTQLELTALPHFGGAALCGPAPVVADYANGLFTIPFQGVQNGFETCIVSGIGGFLDANCDTISLTVTHYGSFNPADVGILCEYNYAIYIGGGNNCSPPTGFAVSDFSENSAAFVWNPISNATAYAVQVRKFGTSDWIHLGEFTSTGVTINGLTSCTLYEYQVSSVCGESTSSFSDSQLFLTDGCDEGDYCSAKGDDSSEEWIASIALSTFDYASGNNQGYGDHTSEVILLEKGKEHSFTLTPGYAEDLYSEYWRIWIDYNQDNDFDDADEMVFDAGNSSTQAVSGSLFLKENAIEGNTRMRIAMKWVDAEDDPALPSACGVFDFGEVEDYTVQITNIVGIEELKNGSTDMILGQSYPNPSSNSLSIPFYLPQPSSIRLSIYDITGQEMVNVLEGKREQGFQEVEVDIANLPNGVYFYQLQSEQKIWSKQMIVTH